MSAVAISGVKWPRTAWHDLSNCRSAPVISNGVKSTCQLLKRGTCIFFCDTWYVAFPATIAFIKNGWHLKSDMFTLVWSMIVQNSTIVDRSSENRALICNCQIYFLLIKQPIKPPPPFRLTLNLYLENSVMLSKATLSFYLSTHPMLRLACVLHLKILFLSYKNIIGFLFCFR